jgi:hypothetical protein
MAELTMADVLRHYGATKVPTGTGWKDVNCPFHGDSHASGRVNVDLGAYKCHGCQMSAKSPERLIAKAEHLTEGEAIEFARSVLGKSIGDLPESVPKSKQRRPLGREKWKSILD